MRRLVPIVLPALILTVGACSSSSSSKATPSSSTTAETSSTIAGSTSSTQPASATTGCTHLPIAHVENSYYGLPLQKGTSIDFVAARLAGDGHGGTVRNAGLSVERTDAHGTITLTTPEAGSSVVLRGGGDFNGDKIGDVLVDVTDGTHHTNYIVLGTVGPGTHDPAEVGERVPSPRIAPGGFAAFPAVVGDQNRDGAEDVGFGRQMYSGRILTSLPTAPTLPAPFRTLPARYLGVLQLAPTGPPAFVVPNSTSTGLRVLDKRSDQLLVGAGTTPPDDEGRVTGRLVSGHPLVQLSADSRSGQTAWRWDLDRACGARGHLTHELRRKPRPPTGHTGVRSRTLGRSATPLEVRRIPQCALALDREPDSHARPLSRALPSRSRPARPRRNRRSCSARYSPEAKRRHKRWGVTQA